MMIQSHLFTNTIVQNFRHEIRGILVGKNVLNMDELFQYFLTDDNQENRRSMWGFFCENIHSLKICKEIVTDEYLRSVLIRSFKNSEFDANFDFAFIFSEIEDVSGIEDGLEKWSKMMEKIVGFIVVERNECPKYGNAYALNYICSKIKGIGSILVGLYVYSIFSHMPSSLEGRVKPIEPREADQSVEYYGPDILHMGLLELSGSYRNVPAFCLYSKFGFIVDETLSGSFSNCFRTDINIAMRTHYPQMSPEDIKQRIVYILLGETQYEFEKPDICEIKDTEIQERLSNLYIYKNQEEKKLKSLMVETKWGINKLSDGSLKPEFKKKLDKSQLDYSTILEEIDLITTRKTSERESHERESHENIPKRHKSIGGKKIRNNTKRNNTKRKKKHIKK